MLGGEFRGDDANALDRLRRQVFGTTRGIVPGDRNKMIAVEVFLALGQCLRMAANFMNGFGLAWQSEQAVAYTQQDLAMNLGIVFKQQVKGFVDAACC